MKMSLRNLEAFRSVVECGSATAAAGALGVTQSAVSRMLAQLEESVGCRLFERRKGRLLLSVEGRMFFCEVEQALDNLDRLTHIAGALSSLKEGQLRITAPPSLAEGLIADVIAEFLARHRGIRLSLESHSPDVSCDLVASNQVDCGIGKLPLETPGVVWEPFVQVDMVCAVPASHVLAAQESICADDLSREPVILLGQGRASRGHIDSAFEGAGIKPQVVLETHTVGAACAMAERNLGIAVVNGLMARQFERRNLVLRRFLPAIAQDLVFMAPANRSRPQLTQAFFKACREHIGRRRDEFFRLAETQAGS